MKVDLYKSVTSVVPSGRPREATYYLERIKDGAVKSDIQDVRGALDKTQKDKAKKKLTAVTFGGTFKTRSKKGLKKSSGLAILDFDKMKDFEDVKKLKAKLSENKYMFSVWVSPSGLGLKALVKIPEVNNNDDYSSYYLSIIESLQWVNKEFGENVIDTSGQDISRLCFESYDEDLYLNVDSEVYLDFVQKSFDETESLGVSTNIPLTDQDDIANRLLIWFKKQYNASERNNSFHKLALAFNDFGVDKLTCERYILPNAQKDFPEAEIKALINSAYKHTSNFGSKFFEDKKKVKQLHSLALIGKTENEIKKQFSDIDDVKIKDEIRKAKEELNVDEFWHYDFEGKLKVSPHKFKFYLENKNFFKHYPIKNSKTFTFITKEDNFVDEVSEFHIKDYVLEELLADGKLEPFDLLASSSRAFNPSYLSMLSTAEIDIERDGKDFSWLYFKNKAMKVFKDSYELKDYEELNGFVWKKQVINREWIDADHHDSEFRSFIWFCASKNKEKYDSLKSVIGYLLHSYKTAATNKAIIFNDETISDNPNGRSGKSLFWNALGHMKKVSSIDGKTFTFDKSFPYQSVPTDTQLLVFDDVKKNFNFESLFSLITEGITLEYKGQDAIKLPIGESPKIIITTNYTIKGSGGSFEARKFEVEMSSYFNSDHSPLDEFGHMLFDDWDDLEWARFDHFMINCLQFFLQNGLVDFPHVNLENRKLINETSSDFIEWIEEEAKYNERITKKDFYLKFIEDNTDFQKWLKQKTFNIWIQKYCEYKAYKYSSGNTNGFRWFMMEKPDPKTLEYSGENQSANDEPTDDIDIWDEIEKENGI